MRRLLATIATALAIIRVLAMTAPADDAGALGLGYRTSPISYDWGRCTGGTLGTFWRLASAVERRSEP
jgi:hypothetical protein